VNIRATPAGRFTDTHGSPDSPDSPDDVIPSVRVRTSGSLAERPNDDFLTLLEVATTLQDPGQHAALVAPARHRPALLQDRPKARHHRRRPNDLDRRPKHTSGPGAA